MENITKSPGGPPLARVRTAAGGTVVRWCGDRAAGPGEYHVEWDVDEDLAWGRNAGPAPDPGPLVRSDGSRVVLRGRLWLDEDGVAVLSLPGTNILLDVAGRLPDGVAGTWIELAVERARASLHPYWL
ncbi:hypothetical protein [Kitasatospora brasiliensis]|uniref:hypothetical protein n=1 Tax=Kitasatospora brasiliensis TaxID=3058040 RepID=UPI00292CBC94|nr:hypothetical protein [Kitasatospora sp. K002]